jgi:hypothetical protein
VVVAVPAPGAAALMLLAPLARLVRGASPDLLGRRATKVLIVRDRPVRALRGRRKPLTCAREYNLRMKPSLLNRISPRTHRRIDLLTFPTLLAAAAVLARRDRRAAGVVLATAAVEGIATATTDYPPPVIGRALSFRAHNAWAALHGVLVAALAAGLPGLTPFGRRALGMLSLMPILMALLSDTSAGSPARNLPTAYLGRVTGDPRAAGMRRARRA